MNNVVNLGVEELIQDQIIPEFKAVYDLTPDDVLLSQAHYESEVRSYPRRFPIAIQQAKGVLVQDTKGQIFLDKKIVNFVAPCCACI